MKIISHGIFALCLLFGIHSGRAQVITNVSTAEELATALYQSFLYSQEFGTLLTNRITLAGNISATNQMIVNANVRIDGAGFSIDMNNTDRAFFIAGGNVAIENIAIQNGYARGGTGYAGGGGGAGLGGAIFVGSGTYYGGVDPTTGAAAVAATGVSAPSVSLVGVTFSNNAAVGGNSITTDQSGEYLTQGGGGGMGGDGGAVSGTSETMGVGGGGFGNGATGAGYPTRDLVSAGAGAMVNVNVPTNATTTAGSGGNGSESNGTAGGVNGGGGGAGGNGIIANGSGGGGGVGGARGYYANGDFPSGGGNGGFGGGGGGAAYSHGPGGDGGFGGGGGMSAAFIGGTGGFGGGGGGYSDDDFVPGAGGFGASRGTYFSGYSNGGGGGGLGAGGAVFVMAGASLVIDGGSFGGNTVQGGQAYFNGSAYGADLFLGADVTFNVDSSLTLNSLGGAGNTADDNVVNNAGANYSTDPNAQGGVIKTGAGILQLTGNNYYSGNTTVNAGSLVLAAGALEMGTKIVTIGQNNGDNATLVLGSNANLTLGGFRGTYGTDAPVMIAQNAGSTGTVVIGNGAGSSGADVGARIFTGGAGAASVIFNQEFAVGSSSNSIYPFYTTLTGSLGVTQSGPGTTLLQPLYGTNTFTGSVRVDAGTLGTAGPVAALNGVSGLTVRGGALALGQSNGVNDAASLTLEGGALETTFSITETFGALTINGPSRIDFAGNTSALTFSALTVGSSLSVWNYTPESLITILSGTATGSLSDITFYSDNGQTSLGTAVFTGNNITPVPEPSTYALLVAAASLIGITVRRRRRNGQAR